MATKAASKKPEINNATLQAELFFNVNQTKRWLVGFYAAHGDDDMYRDMEQLGVQKEQVKTKILKAHYAITAADQVVCISLVNLASPRARKSTGNLYTINENDLLDSIRLDNEFSYAFGNHLKFYDRMVNYSQLMGINYKQLNNFIDTYADGSGNSSIILDDSARNFLLFIMHTNRVMLARSAKVICRYARKVMVDDRSVMCALEIHFTGNLFRTMFKKLENTHRLISSVKDDEKDEKEDNGEGEDVADVVESEKPKDTKPKAKTAVKKVALQVSEDSDSDSDKDSDSDEDSDSDSDEDSDDD